MKPHLHLVSVSTVPARKTGNPGATAARVPDQKYRAAALSMKATPMPYHDESHYQGRPDPHENDGMTAGEIAALIIAILLAIGGQAWLGWIIL